MKQAISIFFKLVVQYLRNILVSIDQFLNVVFLGDEDETISSRLGKSQRNDYGTLTHIVLFPLAHFVNIMAFLITFGKQRNHCTISIEPTEGKNAIVATYRRLKNEPPEGYIVSKDEI